MYNINRVPLKRRPIVLSDETPDNFLGLGKRARARKDRRFEVRMKKKESKIESRAYKKRVKADALAKRYSGKAEAGIIAAQGEAAANMALAQQGIIGNPVSQQPDLASQALGVAGNILGGRAGNGDSMGSPADDQYYEEDQLAPNQLGIKEKQAAEQQAGKKSNTTLYLLIGGAVLLAGFMYMKKK